MLFLIFLTLPCATYPSHSLSFSFHFYHKNQTLNLSTCALYTSDISFFKVFINSCKLTSKMPIEWSFFRWCLTFSDFNVSICNRLNFILIIYMVKLSLRKTKIYTAFLVFSCWAIWRVITCSPLTLRQSFMNTPQH